MSFQDPATIRTVTDQTAFRAIDGTVYTNTTGNTLYVNVTVRTSIALAGEQAYAQVSTSGIPVGLTGIVAGSAGLVSYSLLSFAVIPGITYSVQKTTSGTSTITLYTWIESY